MTRPPHNPLFGHAGSVVARLLGAVGAGYACTAALVALAAPTLSLAFGMARSEAVVLAALSGFLLYLVVLIWGFAERRLWRVWTVLLGGAVLGWGLAPLAAARVMAAS